MVLPSTTDGSPPMATEPAVPVAPPVWAQYRKTLVAFGIALAAGLAALIPALHEGPMTGEMWATVALAFVSALLTAAGVALTRNVYPRAELVRRLGYAPGVSTYGGQ